MRINRKQLSQLISESVKEILAEKEMLSEVRHVHDPRVIQLLTALKGNQNVNPRAKAMVDKALRLFNQSPSQGGAGVRQASAPTSAPAASPAPEAAQTSPSRTPTIISTTPVDDERKKQELDFLKNDMQRQFYAPGANQGELRQYYETNLLRIFGPWVRTQPQIWRLFQVGSTNPQAGQAGTPQQTRPTQTTPEQQENQRQEIERLKATLRHEFGQARNANDQEKVRKKLHDGMIQILGRVGFDQYIQRHGSPF